jgi:O-antigen ligase
LLLVLGALFIDAASHRTRTDFDSGTTVTQSVVEDPRLPLWRNVAEHIRSRPWIGFGFGKSILREELLAELGDERLAHAHNIFVSRTVQTGSVGVASLLALFAALGWRYWTFLRRSDGTLAAIGLAGLVLLLTFVVKNLTDDFLVRPNSKEFWALNALLVGYGIRRVRAN